MSISIIIPTYNEEGDIMACLESLFSQSVKDFEIIIVDDGSTDGTLSEISILGNKVKVLKQKHLGAGSARNLGAKEAEGEILIFVDADMTFSKNFIEKLVKPIKKRKLRGTFSKEEFVANWHNVWARNWNLNEGWEAKKRHPKDYPDTQWVFRAILRSEFERVGGFDPGGYTDDWSLGKKLGYKAEKAPGAIFYHKNPETLGEIFAQAKWVGKRKYKLGSLGNFIALFRASLPISLIIGLFKSIIKLTPSFVVFKVVYDFGLFLGILDYLASGKGSK